MSWKRNYQLAPNARKLAASLNNQTPKGSFAANNYSPNLMGYYEGSENRIERLAQFDQMDLDPVVHSSLNIYADFISQAEEKNKMPITINWKSDPSDGEATILPKLLQKWYDKNKFKVKMFDIVRGCLKYGDVFFIRDPETWELTFVEPFRVKTVLVNEGEGKKPEQYLIEGVDLYLQPKVATKKENNPAIMGLPQAAQQGPGVRRGAGKVSSGYSGPIGSRNPADQGAGDSETIAVDAKHVLHLANSSGVSANWPFGNSILEAIFKVFKQKELIEDALLIWRLQRAPQRNAFYIDVGTMPPTRAKAFIEEVKNELWQRRIPSRTGSGANVLDATYNPLSIVEDYYFAQGADGKGSRVETIGGDVNLGEIDDLKYFDFKLKYGLGVPPSYLPDSPDDPGAQYGDGKVGNSYMQEWRFSRTCERYQDIIISPLDEEFKKFIMSSDYDIDITAFELEFNPPMNFSKYRQIEIDSAQIGVFSQLAEQDIWSYQFLMERFLGLSHEEIRRNESLYKKENPEKFAEMGQDADSASGGDSESAGLDSVGLGGDTGGGDDLGGGDLGDEGGDDLGGEDTGGGDEGGGDDSIDDLPSA